MNNKVISLLVIALFVFCFSVPVSAWEFDPMSILLIGSEEIDDPENPGETIQQISTYGKLNPETEPEIYISGGSNSWLSYPRFDVSRRFISYVKRHSDDNDGEIWVARSTPSSPGYFIITDNHYEDYSSVIHHQCEGPGFKMAWVSLEPTTFCGSLSHIKFKDCGEEEEVIACGNFWGLSFNPDATKIVASHYGNIPDNTYEYQLMYDDLYIIDVDRVIGDTETMVRLTDDEEISEKSPDWSNSGDYVVYVGSIAASFLQEAGSRLYVIRADGSTEEPRIVTRWRDITDYPSWSPDDSRIIYSSAHVPDELDISVLHPWELEEQVYSEEWLENVESKLFSIESGCSLNENYIQYCDTDLLSTQQPNLHLDWGFKTNEVEFYNDLFVTEYLIAEEQSGDCYITSEIENSGNKMAGNSITRFKLVDYSGLGQDDIICDSELVKVDAGKKTIVECPDALPATGEWDIFVYADYTEQVDESDEDNNGWKSMGAIVNCETFPDLVPGDSAHAEQTELPGQCTWGADVKNIGSDDAGESITRLQASNVETNDVVLCDVATQSIDGLSSVDVTCNDPYNAISQGDWKVYVVADTQEQVEERSDNNNFGYVENVYCSEPDLEPVDDSLEYGHTEGGCYVKARIKNSYDPVGPTRTFIELVSTGSPGGINDRECYYETPAMDEGQEIDVFCDELIQRDGVEFDVFVTTDYGEDGSGHVTEFDEDNNRKLVGTFSCDYQLPDLVAVNDPMLEYEIVDDTKCLPKIDIENIHFGIVQSSALPFYIEFDYTSLVGHTRHICMERFGGPEDGNIGPLESREIMCSDHPFPRARGSVVIRVDKFDGVEEFNEDNNVAAGFIDCDDPNGGQGLADLVAIDYTKKTDPRDPHNCIVEKVKIENRGTQLSEFSTTSISIFDAYNGEEVNSCDSYTGTIPPGAPTWTYGCLDDEEYTLTPGRYNMKVTVDAYEEVEEEDEDNTVWFEDIICDGPDYLPNDEQAAIVVTADPYKCGVRVQLENIGAAPLDESYTRFRMEKQTETFEYEGHIFKYDPGYEPVQIADAFTFPIPEDTTENIYSHIGDPDGLIGWGKWKIYATADINDDIEEVNEWNNDGEGTNPKGKYLGEVVCYEEYPSDLKPHYESGHDYDRMEAGLCWVNVIIWNKDSGRVASSKTYIRLEAEDDPEIVETCLVDTYGMNPGSTVIVECDHGVTDRNWKVKVLADAELEIDESNEENNWDPDYMIVDCSHNG